MFDILFNPTFWYVALAVVAIVVIIWACIKFPQGKIFVGTILGIAILCFTFYAGIELNFYYSASGGIYGVITGIFDTNTVEVDDVTFKIQNLELTQNSDDLYTAQIMTDDVISLEKGKVYGLYVNDVPTKTLIFPQIIYKHDIRILFMIINNNCWKMIRYLLILLSILTLLLLRFIQKVEVKLLNIGIIGLTKIHLLLLLKKQVMFKMGRLFHQK